MSTVEKVKSFFSPADGDIKENKTSGVLTIGCFLHHEIKKYKEKKEQKTA